MVMPVHRSVALVLAGLVAAGCADPQGVDPAPHPEVSAEDSAVRLVDDARADLVLFVSNQSFDDEEVRLTVEVDGVTVVEDDFHVEGQHNWIRFPLQLAPGGHEIRAESDSGASMRESFEIPAHGRRYAVLDHWTPENQGSAELSWLFQRRPLAFA